VEIKNKPLKKVLIKTFEEENKLSKNNTLWPESNPDS